MNDMKLKQQDLLDDLWTVYYGNPLYDTNGSESQESYEQVLARALIAVLTSMELPHTCEVPK